MRRLYSILAVVSGLILLAGFVSAVVAPGPGRVPLAKAAVVATLVIDATAGVCVVLMGNGVIKLAGRWGLPEWVAAQAEKNRRKAFIYPWFSLPMLGLAVWSDVILSPGSVDLGIQAANLSFQIGAFFAMSVVVAAQARLSREVSDWANSLGL
jgi:hypothetical protein